MLPFLAVVALDSGCLFGCLPRTPGLPAGARSPPASRMRPASARRLRQGEDALAHRLERLGSSSSGSGSGSGGSGGSGRALTGSGGRRSLGLGFGRRGRQQQQQQTQQQQHDGVGGYGSWPSPGSLSPTDSPARCVRACVREGKGEGGRRGCVR